MNKVAQPTAKTQKDKFAWVNRIDFASEEAGKSAVIIGTTRPVVLGSGSGQAKSLK